MFAKSLLTILTIFTIIVYAQEISIVTEEWKPFNYTERDTLKGMATEVVTSVLKEAGIKYQIDVYPWLRAYNMALENDNVLIYSIGRTEHREKQFKWIGPIAPSSVTGFIKLKSRNDILIENIEDAKKYLIGVTRGSATYKYLIKQGFEINKNIYIINRASQNIKMLLSGRVDIIAGTEWTYVLTAKDLGLSFDDMQIIYKYREIPMYMAFNKKTSDELVDRVRRAYEKVKSTGLLEALEKKYRDLYK